MWMFIQRCHSNWVTHGNGKLHFVSPMVMSDQEAVKNPYPVQFCIIEQLANVVSSQNAGLGSSVRSKRPSSCERITHRNDIENTHGDCFCRMIVVNK